MPTPHEKSVRVRISGRVQGVGFRNWTRGKAAALGLTGWVRNLSDGRVEALFSGAAESVDEMLEHCWKGPFPSKVTSVETEPGAPSEDLGFTRLPNG